MKFRSEKHSIISLTFQDKTQYFEGRLEKKVGVSTTAEKGLFEILHTQAFNIAGLLLQPI